MACKGVRPSLLLAGMSTPPIPPDPSDQDWESLAEDLLGIDLTSQPDVDEPFEVEDFDLAEQSEVAASVEPDEIAAGAREDLADDLVEDVDDVDADDDDDDEVDDDNDADDLDAETESLTEVASDAVKDDYWDALAGWDWDESSEGSSGKKRSVFAGESKRKPDRPPGRKPDRAPERKPGRAPNKGPSAMPRAKWRSPRSRRASSKTPISGQVCWRWMRRNLRLWLKRRRPNRVQRSRGADAVVGVGAARRARGIRRRPGTGRNRIRPPRFPMTRTLRFRRLPRPRTLRKTMTASVPVWTSRSNRNRSVRSRHAHADGGVADAVRRKVPLANPLRPVMTFPVQKRNPIPWTPRRTLMTAMRRGRTTRLVSAVIAVCPPGKRRSLISSTRVRVRRSPAAATRAAESPDGRDAMAARVEVPGAVATDVPNVRADSARRAHFIGCTAARNQAWSTQGRSRLV